MSIINLGQLILPDGQTDLPQRNLPIGTSNIKWTIDFSQMAAGQVILLTAVVSDGQGRIWRFAGNQVGGPFINPKTGQLVSSGSINFGWGIPSSNGWTIDPNLQVTNGPITLISSSLELT